MRAAAFAFAFLVPVAAHAAPLQYLSGAGTKAAPVVWLTWGVLLISVVVTVVIAALLVGAIWHRPGLRMAVGERSTLAKDEGGQNWLWIGVGISALVLLITTIWTVKVLADIQAPAVRPAATIEVTGRQWWWQLRYLADDAAPGFMTANEIHIPTGAPVRLTLIGGDVIHSFWVPQLAGKMDAIPGQTNRTWIEADRPGVYTGQCTEYCGVQHARMLLRVIAQSPADFRAWRARQMMPASSHGAQVFLDKCGRCHAVRGTEAAGTLGPDLSHLMQRDTIASAALPNDVPTLARWIADPQGAKPGNLMPAVPLTDRERADLLAYLETLR